MTTADTPLVLWMLRNVANKDYGRTRSFVVVAASEASARLLIGGFPGVEGNYDTECSYECDTRGRDGEDGGHVCLWSDPTKSTCERLGVADAGPERIVQMDRASE